LLQYRVEIKNEFWLIAVASILLTVLIGCGAAGTLRVILGLPFVLFFPGYTLIAALFPGRDDLDGIERVALSFGLSIAVVPLLGLILNYTPWGIRLYPILITLLVFTTAMSVVSIYRRNKLNEAERFTISWPLPIPKWKGLSGLDKVLSVALVGAILFALGSLYYVATTPKVGEKFTEFYVLGPGGKAEGYPRELRIKEGKEVILGVVNHEYRRVAYSIEVRMDGYTKQTIGPVELNHEEKYEGNFILSAVETHKNMKVEFLLTKDGESEPYRTLHLWVDVSE